MPSEVPELRASYEDRNRVVDALRVAGGDGRLTAEELDARLESALAARTLGELAELTADLPLPSEGVAAKDVLVVEQRGGKYVRDGRWRVPARIAVTTRLCTVVLDFTDAMVTSSAVRIDTEMEHGKLIIVGAPGIVIDADGLTLNYSKCKLRAQDPESDAAGVKLRVEIVGSLKFAKVIERAPRGRQRSIGS